MCRIWHKMRFFEIRVVFMLNFHSPKMFVVPKLKWPIYLTIFSIAIELKDAFISQLRTLIQSEMQTDLFRI